MNVIYKVVFNYATGQWTAVSEIAKGKTKSSRTNSAVVEQTTRQVKYSPVRMVSASLLLGLVSFLGTNSAYALTIQDKDELATDLRNSGTPNTIQRALIAALQNPSNPVNAQLIASFSANTPTSQTIQSVAKNATAQALNENGDNPVKTALSVAIQKELNKDSSDLKTQFLSTVAEEVEKENSDLNKAINELSKKAVADDLSKKANTSDVNAQFEAHKGLIDSVTDAIHGSEGLNAQILNLKTNSVTKEELDKGLKDKANQSDFNFLNEEVNKLNVGIANVIATATQTARDLEQTNTELAELKLSTEATKEILNSQVENINGSLATISNDVTDLKGKVANTATKDDLKEKANQLDLELLTEQLNNTNTDLANTKGDLATVSTKLDTTANELNNVKTDLEGTKAILESQVDNINGSLAAISNNVTDLQDKVANAATKEELNDKVSNTAFNILNQQVNQNSADVAEAKAATNEVANDLNEFKYNSAVAIAGLAVTTAEEFEKTNAEVEKTKDAVAATQAMLNSQVENINGSLATISNDVTDLKGKIANAATKDDLKEKANQLDLELLTEQLNNTNTDLANTKGNLATVSTKLDTTANEVNNVKADLEGTKAILESQVNNINGSLATISNDVTDLKGKVTNAATKEELNDKVSNTAFNILNQQVNQNSVDVAEAKAATNEVANDLNEFKYNSAVAIAGLAVTTAEEFEKTNAEVEKTKDAVAATQAMLNSQVENINGSLATISNDVTDLKGKVANAATKDDLKQKANQSDFNQLTQQVNQNSADAAEAKAAANEVANDLNNFKYNAAVAIAAVAETAASEIAAVEDKVNTLTTDVAKELAQTNANVADNALAINNGSLETISNDVTDLKGKVANAATKDDLKQKANQSDFNQLTQQVNKNSADVAEAKAAANEVANDLNNFKYNAAAAIAGLAAETETLLNTKADKSEVSEIANDLNDFKYNAAFAITAVAETAAEEISAVDTKVDALADATRQSFNNVKETTDQLNQDISTVSSDLNEFKHNAAVAIAGLAVTTAEEFEKTNADIEKNKAAIVATSAQVALNKASIDGNRQAIVNTFKEVEKNKNDLNDFKHNAAVAIAGLAVTTAEEFEKTNADVEKNKAAIVATSAQVALNKASIDGNRQAIANTFNILNDKKADRTEVAQALDAKANKVVVDAQINALNELKADKTAIQALDDKKANRTEVAQALDAKANKVVVDAQINALNELKADKAAVQALDDKKANRTEVAQALDAKANKVVVDAQINALNELKADKAAVQALDDKKANRTEVAQALDAKANKVVVDAQINALNELKADKTAVTTLETKVDTKADKTAVTTLETKVNGKVSNETFDSYKVYAEQTYLKQADAQNIQNNISAVEQKVEKLGDNMEKGFAAQAALTGLFQPYNVGKVNTSVALGGYKSQNAIAFGAGYRPNENFAIKGGFASSTSGGNTSYNIGINYEW